MAQSGQGYGEIEGVRGGEDEGVKRLDPVDAKPRL
jgi:hypothetical protein